MAHQQECMLCCAEKDPDRFQKVYRGNDAYVCHTHTKVLYEIINMVSAGALLYRRDTDSKTPVLIDDLWS